MVAQPKATAQQQTTPILEEVPARRPLKRVEYDQLVALGSFGEERLELLFGELVSMSPQNEVHALLTFRFGKALTFLLAGKADVRCHSPIVAAGESAPEPDVAVYDPADNESGAHPTHVWLVIEVADSSRAKDLGPKAQLYAASAIPEYWVVDLPKRVVRVMREPTDGEYRRVQTHDFGSGTQLEVERFPGASIDLDEIVKGL